MATTAFSSLPAEILFSIAKHCENKELINLCLTSKLVKERCLAVLYRHVVLERSPQVDSASSREECSRVQNIFKRQQQLVQTLRSHPEYSKHVRSFQAPLCTLNIISCCRSREDRTSEVEFWSAIGLLTHVKIVDIGSKSNLVHNMTVPSTRIPSILFQSATSVRLVGYMQYRLAKVILDAVNPAMLKHLSLDMVQDRKPEVLRYPHYPGAISEDGRMVARGSISGLLTAFTGRCTALQTLALRRVGQVKKSVNWHAAAEEACHLEWASFIRSVQGTVEGFIFGQAGKLERGNVVAGQTRIMDDRFRQFLLPTIVSGSWPCLRSIELQGIRHSNGQGGNAELTMELRAVLGGTPKILVTEDPQYLSDFGREFTISHRKWYG